MGVRVGVGLRHRAGVCRGENRLGENWEHRDDFDSVPGALVQH